MKLPTSAPPEPSQKSDRIITRVVEEEMKEAYVNYAMSVIVGRALPDVRDGLKPVHRRILYTAYDMGLLHNKPFKKCARIVGECMGKYHPHGDISVYDSLVRMAQDFSLRYPLIKGQGNFGSIDADPPAAMRYTEAKLQAISEEMLKDIDKETVNFKDNFDASLKEPEVLPSAIPNLLINGSSGIAVGMATNIPPHNLKEVCRGSIALLDNPELSAEELQKFIPAPDFPTGGELICGTALHHAYTYGRGKITIKSVTELENQKIIVKEIPYQVNKSELIEEIASLVQDKKIQDIRNINDESDREGIRIVIDLKKDADPQVVLNQLYQFSRLQISFGLIMLALVNNQPCLLGLKDLINHHLSHRRIVIVRRTEFELKEAQEKVHLLEGLLVALNNLDEVIPGIRNSRTIEDAQVFLTSHYSLSERQAKAILELRLQKLASLEQEKIKSEHQTLLGQIAEYKSILSDDKKVSAIIKGELQEIMKKYGDERRSKVTLGTDEDGDFNMEELINEESAVITVTKTGYIKRQPLDAYRLQKRGGKGILAAGMKEEDVVEAIYIASTHDYLLCFTNEGQMYWLKVYQIPEASRQAKGRHIANLLEFNSAEKITAIVPVQGFTEGYLFMATKKGTVKKTELKEFSSLRKGGIRAITLEEGDSLIRVRYTAGKNEIILATKQGSANRFSEEDVRFIGRAGMGVRGIRLEEGDEVIGMLAAEEGKEILTLTEKGYGKRTPVSDYRLCSRGGKGVTNIKTTDKNGPVKTVMLVDGTEELMLVSQQGVGIRIKCSDVSLIGRATQGVRVMRLQENDSLAAAAKIVVDTENIVAQDLDKTGILPPEKVAPSDGDVLDVEENFATPNDSANEDSISNDSSNDSINLSDNTDISKDDHENSQ
ncbi:DNA gyrase subunit A [Candidatus Woesearchaeota archaeon]|nr:DNA gyrase subunit A [Candidatus Woesearchaeota archaeon]